MLKYQMVAESARMALPQEEASVLVVDDNRDVRESLHYALRSCGMQVTLCENPTEALLAAMVRSFDFILTGFDLEGMDGIELVRRLRNLQPTLTVIIGLSNRDLQDRFLAEGANDFVKKPFVPCSVAMMIDGGDFPA